MPYGYGASADFSPSSSSSSGGGCDARESYGRGGQYLQTTIPSPALSITTGGGGDNIIDPGFVRALDEQARFQTALGDPDPYVDVPISERDTITSFLDNYAANVKANPFEFGLLGALKTLYQTEQAKNMLLGTPGYEFLRDYNIPTDTPIGGDQQSRDVMTGLVGQLPYTLTGTTPQQSMVNQYFANLGTMGQQPLSSNLQTSYNNAKTTINNLLGITPPSQQFGYSAQPYGSLSSGNLAMNLFNIDYLKQRGLI